MLNAEKHGGLVYYQCVLAIAAVLVFFTNFDTYWEVAIAAPSPKIWVAIFWVAATPLLLSLTTRIAYLSKTTLLWLCAYLGISLGSLLLAHDLVGGSEELKNRLFSIGCLIIFMLLFSQYELVQLWVRRTILFVTPINIAANLYGLVRPEHFATIVESQSILATGRPAGFYVDSNRAGCAVILGLVFGLDLLPPKYRLPLILLSLIGIFVTFSRSAPLIFLVVLAIWFIRREISHKQISLWLTLAGIGLTLVLAFSSGDIGDLEQSGYLNQNTMERITQFQNPLAVKGLDDSALGRVKMVEISWEKITESPLIGWGTGYGLTLAALHPEYDNIKAHNMYIALMLEHGVLGGLIFPALVFATIYQVPTHQRTISLTFASLVLIWGLFSHNVLEHREFLLTFALMSSMNVKAMNLKDHENCLHCD
jgi:O-antigen ligase